MFKRIVQGVQVAAALVAVTFVVLLFANEPDDAPEPTSLGAQVYADNCAGCHGADGGGGVGPSLLRITDVLPNEADEIAVVTDGRGSMPAWDGRLSADEIRAVVAYTRSDL